MDKYTGSKARFEAFSQKAKLGKNYYDNLRVKVPKALEPTGERL